MQINYSFIIPHKDSQALLYRCIDSIPIRDDIQIIVIDDNSNCKEFDTAYLEKHNVKLLLSHKSITAGGARNLGLKDAVGRWLLFADADDYYTPEFIQYLDRYVNSKYDIVFFDIDDSQHPKIKFERMHKVISNSNRSRKDIEYLKYGINNIWFKMFNSNLIKQYDISFESAMSGNDTLFTFVTSYFAQNIAIINRKLYTYSYIQNSITFINRSVFETYEALKQYLKYKAFLAFIGQKKYATSYIRFFLSILKKYGFLYFYQFCMLSIRNWKEIRKIRKQYINYVLEKSKKN